MKKLIMIALFVSFIQINAQTKSEDTCPCCTDKHAQFDFWLGNWKVFNTDGKTIGTNTITKLYDQCVLKEEWISTGSSNGTSTNYYNKSDDSWNQVWVDNSGYSLVLKGMLIDGKMILKSELIEGQKGWYYNQISWTPNKDGSVTQLWELFKKDGTLIQESFRGIYKKEK
ncbi:MAG: hypothetical protein BM563_06970 [Bacteroidetes bacterium MedPE-SWsnd-G1]|nr:MAG: hypothetical protein BM563_06970 [Bacteroidetes bacterium MedPE-SWsnd-G1]